MNRIEIRNGRSPFQTALTGVSATSGLLGLVLPPPGPSGNIAQAFGAGTHWFYLALFVSAVIVLVGPWWPPRSCIRNLMLSMRIERIGLIPLGSCSLAYAVANLLISGKAALIAGLLIGGIGVASWVRARIITRDLRKLDRLITLDQSGPTSETPADGGDTQPGAPE